MFKDEYHPQIKKDIKKLDRPVVDDLYIKHIDMVIRNPYKGEELAGELSGIYSYHFKKNKVDYRICYWINEDEKIVYILMIGKRENFYKILRNRL